MVLLDDYYRGTYILALSKDEFASCSVSALRLTARATPRKSQSDLPNTARSLVLAITRDSGKCRYRPPDKEFRYLRTVIVTAGVR